MNLENCCTRTCNCLTNILWIISGPTNLVLNRQTEWITEWLTYASAAANMHTDYKAYSFFHERKWIACVMLLLHGLYIYICKIFSNYRLIFIFVHFHVCLVGVENQNSCCNILACTQVFCIFAESTVEKLPLMNLPFKNYPWRNKTFLTEMKRRLLE